MRYLIFLPIIPVLFYFVDAYYEKNTKKGFLYIAAFLLFIIIGYLMLKLIGWSFALWTPILLLFILSLKAKKKSKQSNSLE
jgi:hypothetical protein